MLRALVSRICFFFFSTIWRHFSVAFGKFFEKYNWRYQKRRLRATLRITFWPERRLVMEAVTDG
ncbi:hypothetical protein ERO13_A03G078250v2 [Gossypium hirsutum]|nr:hypothetical protein ERO13_A03G078250v2 [Gossypium hirsutum]